MGPIFFRHYHDGNNGTVMIGGEGAPELSHPIDKMLYIFENSFSIRAFIVGIRFSEAMPACALLAACFLKIL